MKFTRIPLLVALGVTLTACDQIPLNNQDTQPQAQADAAAADTSEVLATVNGTPVTRNMLDSYMQQRAQRQHGNMDPQAALQELINLELVRQDGVRKGLDKQPEIAAQIEQQKRAVIAGAALQQQLQSVAISDEDLKKLYDEKIGSGGKEFKARHILVKDEAKAKEIIAELDKGGDFAELAKKYSTGPTGKNGGELGWFSPKQMVKPFSDAAAGLEKGQYTKEPVKTQFGWHVIELEDVRESSPPSFEQVKPQLRALAQNQRIQGYIQQLREKADVEVKNAPQADDKAKAESSQGETATP